MFKNCCHNHSILKNFRFGDVFHLKFTCMNKTAWWECEGCKKIFSEDELTKSCVEAGGLI